MRIRIAASIARLSLALLGLTGLARAQGWVPVPRPGVVVAVNPTLDRAGNRYTISADGHTLVKTTPAGGATTLATAQSVAAPTGGVSYVSLFTGLTVDQQDNVYVADTPVLLHIQEAEQIRKISPAGVVNTFTVSGIFPLVGRIPNSCSVTVDGVGNIYSVGVDGSVIQIKADGTQSIVASDSQWFLTPIFSFPNPPQGLAVDDQGRLFANATNLNPNGYAGPIEFIRANASPFIAVDPKGANILVGSTLSLSVYAVSTGELSYQWYLNGVAINGATSANLAATLSGSYTVVVTTAAGAVTSAPAIVTLKTSAGLPVIAAPTITQQPHGATIVFGTVSTLSVTAVSTAALSYQWYSDGVAISGATNNTYATTLPGSYTVRVSTAADAIISAPAVIATTTADGIPVVSAPTIIAQPKSVGLAYGGTAKLSVAAVATMPVNYQWWVDGSKIPGATAASFTAGMPGNYSVTSTTAAGSVTSDPVVVALTNRPGNLSSRASVGTGGNISIAGFVVSSYSGAAKRVLIRAAGPGLSSLGVTGVLARPILSLYDSQGQLVASNTGWNDVSALAAAATATGAFSFAAGSADCALLLDLAPGGYTAQVSGVAGTTGVALVEVYELAPDSGHFVNISTRAVVGTGANILIGGLVVSGTEPSLMLIRAIGPALGSFGVGGFLVQPVLSIYDASGRLVAVNVGWSNGGSAEAVALAAAASKTGAFPLPPGSTDSALLLTLAPGAYTAQVSGVNSTTGVALLEIYQVPQ